MEPGVKRDGTHRSQCRAQDVAYSTSGILNGPVDIDEPQGRNAQASESSQKDLVVLYVLRLNP